MVRGGSVVVVVVVVVVVEVLGGGGGWCVGMDSDLEAFGRFPTSGRFARLASQLGTSPCI